MWDDFQKSKNLVQSLIEKANENLCALKTEAETNTHKDAIIRSKDILQALLTTLPSKSEQERYEIKAKDILYEYQKLAVTLLNLSLQVKIEKTDEITRNNTTLSSKVEHIQHQMKYAEWYHQSLLHHKDQEIWQMKNCLSSEYMQWHESYQKNLQRLHSHSAEYANNNQVIQEELKKAKEEYVSQKKIYEKLRTESKLEIDVLNQKLEELQSNLDALREAKDEYKIVNDNLEAELSFYMEAYEGCSTQKKIDGGLDGCADKMRSLEADLDFYMEAYEKCQNEATKLKGELSHYVKTAKELERYKTENRNLEADLFLYMEAHMEAHTEATKLREDLSSYMKACEDASKNIERVDEESENECNSRVTEDPYQNIDEAEDIAEPPKKKMKQED